MARWQSSNVLHVAKEGRQVWHFSNLGGKIHLQRADSRLPNEALPAKLVVKDWQALVQPKLNIAWLPCEQVFLRTLQLPKSDLAETRSMVELQLEKLSPMPVAQVVWSFELLPHVSEEMQTAVVVVVARSLVEEFLGHLEKQGYLADRLELPQFDQLRVASIHEDGVWLYPGLGVAKNHCLLAWWYGGVLQHVSMVHLPPPDQCAALLKLQLSQTIWAGELEGWLTGPPRVHVVTDGPATEAWVEEFIREEAAEVVPATPLAELATQTVRRLAQDGATTNLLPPEYTARYRQQFIDRLWMRCLGVLLAVYLMGLAVYFGWVEVARWRLENIRKESARLANSYTNTVRLKQHVGVLQEQLNLQYAALDCWRSVAEFLPPELQLESLNFEEGRKLSLRGTAPNDAFQKVQDFNAALQSVKAGDQPLFKMVDAPKLNEQPGGQQQAWFFNCELRLTGTE